MDHVQTKENGKSSKLEHGRAREKIRRRVARARDLVDTVRERTDIAFHDRPYLVPLAAGALGVGIGVLFASKLTRLLVFTAVGSVMSDAFGGEIKRVGRDLLDELQQRLAEGEAEPEEG